jgi:hypothetical protein
VAGRLDVLGDLSKAEDLRPVLEKNKVLKSQIGSACFD